MVLQVSLLSQNHHFKTTFDQDLRTCVKLAVAYAFECDCNIHGNGLCFVCYPTGMVAMHIESLEPVYREYKNLAYSPYFRGT